MTQDRLTEKTFVEKLGLKTAPFFEVSSGTQAREAFGKLNGKGILKTRRFGYDGKGQAKVVSADEAAKAFESFKGAAAILEGFVDFSCEASVVAARGQDGAFAAYDPPENEHEHHILRRSTVPSRLTPAQVDEAKAIAQKIGDALDYVGVFAVELFVARTARCWSMRSRRGSTIRATGPSRPVPVPSSSSISAPWPDGRWAIPAAIPMR